MKNKLVKTGHKKGYYAARKMGLGTIISLSILSLAAVPVMVVYNNAIHAKAEEENVIVAHVEEDADEVVSSLPYEE